MTQTALARCDVCSGCWIAESTLREHVSEMKRAPATLEWTVCDRPQLPCVECGAPMQPIALEMVPIDRCAKHGVWFDGGELARVLLLASGQREDGGEGITVGEAVVGGLDAAGTAADVVVLAEAAGSVGEAVAGVVGGLLSSIDL